MTCRWPDVSITTLVFSRHPVVCFQRDMSRHSHHPGSWLSCLAASEQPSSQYIRWLPSHRPLPSLRRRDIQAIRCISGRGKMNLSALKSFCVGSLMIFAILTLQRAVPIFTLQRAVPILPLQRAVPILTLQRAVHEVQTATDLKHHRLSEWIDRAPASPPLIQWHQI